MNARSVILSRPIEDRSPDGSGRWPRRIRYGPLAGGSAP